MPNMKGRENISREGNLSQLEAPGRSLGSSPKTTSNRCYVPAHLLGNDCLHPPAALQGGWVRLQARGWYLPRLHSCPSPAAFHQGLGPVQLLLWHQHCPRVGDVEEMLQAPHEGALVPARGVDVEAKGDSGHFGVGLGRRRRQLRRILPRLPVECGPATATGAVNWARAVAGLYLTGKLDFQQP